MKLNYETNRLRDSQFVVNQTNLVQAENPCRMLPTFRRPLFLSAHRVVCSIGCRTGRFFPRKKSRGWRNRFSFSLSLMPELNSRNSSPGRNPIAAPLITLSRVDSSRRHELWPRGRGREGNSFSSPGHGKFIPLPLQLYRVALFLV